MSQQQWDHSLTFRELTALVQYPGKKAGSHWQADVSTGGNTELGTKPARTSFWKAAELEPIHE